MKNGKLPANFPIARSQSPRTSQSAAERTKKPGTLKRNFLRNSQPGPLRKMNRMKRLIQRVRAWCRMARRNPHRAMMNPMLMPRRQRIWSSANWARIYAIAGTERSLSRKRAWYWASRFFWQPFFPHRRLRILGFRQGRDDCSTSRQERTCRSRKSFWKN